MDSGKLNIIEMIMRAQSHRFVSAPLFALVVFISAAMAEPAAPFPAKYDTLIQTIAARYRVDTALVHSIIAAESNYNRYAVSDKGAQGLMQLMPETARDCGVRDVFNAADNIEGGVKFLKTLQEKYPNQPDLVLAAYNAGPTAVQKHGGVPPYPETKTYIARVKAYLRQAPKAKKTEIYVFRDKEGRLVITNDIRLVPPAGGQGP
jgi:soluble lytic murein transglycosylase-like protein